MRELGLSGAERQLFELQSSALEALVFRSLVGRPKVDALRECYGGGSTACPTAQDPQSRRGSSISQTPSRRTSTLTRNFSNLLGRIKRPLAFPRHFPEHFSSTHLVILPPTNYDCFSIVSDYTGELRKSLLCNKGKKRHKYPHTCSPFHSLANYVEWLQLSPSEHQSLICS